MRLNLPMLAATTLLATACAMPDSTTETAATPAVPETEEDKTFFALGLAISTSLDQYDLTAEEAALVMAGLEAGIAGEDTGISLDDFQGNLRTLGQDRMKARADKEKVAANEFLVEMAAMDGAESFESGLIMFTLTEGDGPSPTATDTVKVHYHGTLRDGSVFDSSVDRGAPATFPLNRVIACWTEGVQKMKVGGKSRLVCPAVIAYGDRGSPPRIPPGAPLVFEVELLEVQ